ncbi:MAG: Holliday junction resolvase RuvX [Planctomycetota bacterium]
MRFLAIDLGDRRTGLAVGDTYTGLAGPAGVLEVPRDRDGGLALLRALDDAIEEHLGPSHMPGGLVLGLPLHMDGSESPRAKLARAFAETLKERTGRTVYLQDERLTSIEADERMARTGMTHKQKKRKRDALAAAAMLTEFLRAQREQAPADGWGDGPPTDLGYGPDQGDHV